MPMPMPMPMHFCMQMFVLDEADEMLSRGFKDQIYDIFQLLPPKLQVGAIFSFVCWKHIRNLNISCLPKSSSGIH